MRKIFVARCVVLLSREWSIQCDMLHSRSCNITHYRTDHFSKVIKWWTLQTHSNHRMLTVTYGKAGYIPQT